MERAAKLVVCQRRGWLARDEFTAKIDRFPSELLRDRVVLATVFNHAATVDAASEITASPRIVRFLFDEPANRSTTSTARAVVRAWAADPWSISAPITTGWGRPGARHRACTAAPSLLGRVIGPHARSSARPETRAMDIGREATSRLRRRSTTMPTLRQRPSFSTHAERGARSSEWLTIHASVGSTRMEFFMKICRDDSLAARRDRWIDTCSAAALISVLLIVGHLACPSLAGVSMAYSGGGAVVLGIGAMLCLGLESRSARLALSIGLVSLMILRALSPIRPDLFIARHAELSAVDAGGLVLLIFTAILMVDAAKRSSASGPNTTQAPTEVPNGIGG